MILSLGERTLPIPRIGLGAASHGEAPGEREIARLRALHLSHLRVDLALGDPNCPSMLHRAAAEAEALDVPIEAALLIPGDAVRGAMEVLRALFARRRPRVGRWLALSADPEQTLEKRVLEELRSALHALAPGVPVFGGTNAYFAQLNRSRPPLAALDGVCYSANPQVHAFDDASLVETPDGLAATVESARALSGELPLAVTPITLKPRFNPNATAPTPEPPISEADPRQRSLLGAGWTLGVIARLARGGVASATLYETTGGRGVMEANNGACVFPLYHVLADVGAHGGEVITGALAHLETASDDPHLEALALRRDGETRVLLANLSAEEKTVTIRNLGCARVHVRPLDETNAETAMRAPEAFRSRRGEEREVLGGSLTIRLLPYALARIDE